MKLGGDGSGARRRVVHTRVFAAGIFALLMLSGNRVENGAARGLLDLAGLGCVTISAFGRVWASVYISGYKTGTLIDSGPYSVTRNPLYLFSLIGAAGLGITSGSILIFALLTCLFAFYYPAVIRREEASLERIHGPEFRSYEERVPMFFPKFSLFSEPDTYLLNTKQFRRALIDASYFIWIYGGLVLVMRLREVGILPTLFKIP